MSFTQIHEESTFAGARVDLDGKAFRRCKFTNCELVYSGGAFPELINNRFVDCTWKFEGAALRTLIYLNGLYRSGATDVVNDLFAEIKGGQADAQQ